MNPASSTFQPLLPPSPSINRQDTAHPACHGCIEWHAGVHGLYVLLTMSRLTGKPPWSHLAESLFMPEKLDREFSCIQNGRLNQELPYGYAWFLKLAQDRKRFFQKDDLQTIAKELARPLQQWTFPYPAVTY